MIKTYYMQSVLTLKWRQYMAVIGSTVSEWLMGGISQLRQRNKEIIQLYVSEMVYYLLNYCKICVRFINKSVYLRNVQFGISANAMLSSEKKTCLVDYFCLFNWLEDNFFKYGTQCRAESIFMSIILMKVLLFTFVLLFSLGCFYYLHLIFHYLILSSAKEAMVYHPWVLLF